MDTARLPLGQPAARTAEKAAQPVASRRLPQVPDASAAPHGGGDGAAVDARGVRASPLARWNGAAAHVERAWRSAVAGGMAMQASLSQLAHARTLLASGESGDDAPAEPRLTGFLGAAVAAGEAVSLRPESARPVGAEPRALPGRYAFRRQGDYWTLACDGRVTHLRSQRGFEYIAELLRHPDQALYAIDLADLGAPATAGLSAAEAAAQGLRVGSLDVPPARLDARARAQYRARWRELRHEAAAAERDNDPGRLAGVQREIDMLARELAAARASGRSPRQERARVNVRNCISAALRAIRRHDEGLWRHLANAIKTGTSCCYTPERPIAWEL